MIGKFLYVITGSHYDFASHVASYAIGEDWKDLFDIVIFFARKPSFFLEKRPFWRLDGPVEVMIISWEFSDTPLCFYVIFYFPPRSSHFKVGKTLKRVNATHKGIGELHNT